MVQGVYPQSLDPAKDYTTQGAEVNWLVYTGLTTYAHANGTASTKLIPGLATALPVISDGGKTYTATLRPGLKFSNGQPVKASDFDAAVERAIKVPWGGSGQFITPVIVGATAFSTGKAKTISGITTDDKTGKITIHLTAPYGAFDNVLAEPSMGFVPTGTPNKEEPSSPPPGVGPYKVTNIVVNQSYSVVKNPDWTPVPGIPSGHVNINVKISANTSSNALAVLNNTADVYRLGGHDPRQPAAADPCQGHGSLRVRQPRRLGVLHLPQLAGQAVQQPACPRGGRHRPQRGGVQPPERRARWRPAATSCRRPSRVTRRARARTGRLARGTWPRRRRCSSSRAWRVSR